MNIKIVMFKDGIVPDKRHAYPQPMQDFEFDGEEFPVNEWHDGLLMQSDGSDPLPFMTKLHEYPNSCGGTEIEIREFYLVE